MTSFSRQILLWMSVAVCVSCAKLGTLHQFDPLESDIAGLSAGESLPSTPGEGALTKAEPLVWESAAYPVRAQWSSELIKIVRQNFSTLNRASDIGTFCPTYTSLSDEQKINVWANLFAATTYFESGWNPLVNSTDVGTASDQDTWSVGLLQLSVVDQQSYHLDFGYKFVDLQDPVKNLHLGVAIMSKQVARVGTVLITGTTGLYWATLHPGGRYDATDKIAVMTKKMIFCH